MTKIFTFNFFQDLAKYGEMLKQVQHDDFRKFVTKTNLSARHCQLCHFPAQ